MENVFYMDHPLIQHKISILRAVQTGTNEFRKLVEEIAVYCGTARKTGCRSELQSGCQCVPYGAFAVLLF